MTRILGGFNPKTRRSTPKKRLIVGFHRLFILPTFGFLESPRNVSHPLMDPESNVKGMMGYSFHVATRGHTYAMVMSVKWVFGMRQALGLWSRNNEQWPKARTYIYIYINETILGKIHPKSPHEWRPTTVSRNRTTQEKNWFILIYWLIHRDCPLHGL